MSSPPNKNSMGDLFMQRRRDRAASSVPASGLTMLSHAVGGSAGGVGTAGERGSSEGGGSFKPNKSFAEIQREQEQQKQMVDEFGRLQRPSGVVDRGDRMDRGDNNRGGARSSNASSYGRRSNNNSNTRNSNIRDYNRHSSLPLEQGVIHTLLDKFGFILCADRNLELFFHYSELRDGHSDELNIGDEVEFRVGAAESRRGGGGGGRDGEEKLCSYDVRLLPKGTIYWEKEDEPGKLWKGVVELPIRDDRQRSGGGGGMSRDGKPPRAVNGVLRLAPEEPQKEDLEILFTPADYNPKSGSGGSSNRLGKGDVVEFTLVTERRTGKKYARNIQLIQSERERLREEREAKLLEDATLEQGKVVSVRGDFGFLRSANRVEEVYFHVSNILEGETMLEEGTEVEFYVVNEGSQSSGSDNRRGGGGGGKKGAKSLSARKIKVLPEGTVKFEHVLAEGVAGVVLDCPIEQRVDPFGTGGSRSEKKSGKAAIVGTIRLQEPITDEHNGEEVTEVTLHPSLYPGGTYAMTRMGSEMGSWIRPGDVLLFDVIRQLADGTCRAVPTTCTQVASLRSDSSADDESTTKQSVRLVEPSLMGRAEGVIRSIRDNYGFIHCAERNVDAYFAMYEVFPNELHGDLIRNNPDVYCDEETNPNIQKGGRINVEVGMEVSFDLSSQMLTNQPGGGPRGGGGRGKQNIRAPQESLRARRIQILPKGTVQEKISIASGLKATVTKDDPNQPFVGTLEFEESIKVQTTDQRHPLVAKLLDSVSDGKYGDEIIFHDVLSEKEAQVIVSMVNSRHDLEWRYVPLSGGSVEDCQHRILCIAKRSVDDTKDESKSDVDATSEPAANGDEKMDTNESTDEGEDIKTEEIKAEVPTEGSPKPETHKKKSKKDKIVKSLRFDKYSFPDMSIGPIGVGDIVTCDIVQSRSSGTILVENVVVVERKERPPAPELSSADAEQLEKKGLRGFVTEVVPSRQFGFITAVDEHGSKTGEHVFFHFKSVGAPDEAQDASTNNKRNGNADIRKADEVQFDAAPGKNGKFTATNIAILPRGTLKAPPVKVDKSSCTGYILLEPSHTSLANTPSHIVRHNGPPIDGHGRWDNVGKEEKTTLMSGSIIKEEGVILLLSDPSNLFSKSSAAGRSLSIDESKPERKVSVGDVEAEETIDTDARGDAVETETKEDGDGASPEKVEVVVKVESAVGTHLRYKLSSMALRSQAAGVTTNRPEGPRRGDLVSFSKTKGAKLLKDIRIEKMDAATTVRGVLVDIKTEENKAVFVSTENDQQYDVNLTEVVSCDKSLLQENEQVDGILHEGKLFGVCRTKDIFLISSFGRNSSGSSSGGLKERPRLNLTVKKELQGMGGQIMAQSGMAKGPDATIGFVPGWTKRLSPHVKEYVPPTIEVSGFESTSYEEGDGCDGEEAES